MASDMLPEMTHSMVENNLSADVWNMVDIYLHSYRCSNMVSRGTHCPPFMLVRVTISLDVTGPVEVKMWMQETLCEHSCRV